MESDVLDVHEAAAYLRINEQTLRRLARTQSIPAFKVGGIWRFRKSVLDEWAVEQTESTPTIRVLVIDDNTEIHKFIKDILGLEGYAVDAAEDGKAGLARMRENSYDLVLLDLLMPGMNGPDTIKAIREEFGEVAVIIHTAYPDSEMMTEAMHHSPLMLLPKPCTVDQILSCVRTLALKKKPT